MKLQSPIKGAILKKTTDGGTLTQLFGENLNPLYKQLGMLGHNGIDFNVPTGTPVYAAHDGTVTKVFNNEDSTFTRGYGVYVQSNWGWFTVYWHMLVPAITVGTYVHAGDLLGYSNNSGASTGSHLHFGFYPNPSDFQNGYDGAVNPMPYLDGTDDTAQQIVTVVASAVVIAQDLPPAQEETWLESLKVVLKNLADFLRGRY